MIFCNYHSAGNQNFKDSMKDLVQDHYPDIVILMETKVCLNTMGNFFHQFGLLKVAYSNPIGRMRGIWVLWNPVAVNLQLIHISNQVIHLLVTKVKFEDWVISAIYTSLIHILRDYVWINLHMLAQNCSLPWLVVGDFTDYMNNMEKRSFTRDLNTTRSSTS